MSAPNALFDLAINRAANTLRGLPTTGRESALSEWHARTRFARRVPLSEVVRCLASRPTEAGIRDAWHWQGGPQGSWQIGKAAFP